MAAPQQGYIELGGARLAYDVAGDGPAVVMIHAGIADRHMYDAQIAAFATRYRVVRYDLRGFGDSAPAPEAPFAHREDLYALLAHLGIDRAALIGTSMGGTVAIDAALERPDLVRALVPVCSSASGYNPDGPQGPGWDEVLAEGGEVERLFQQGDVSQAIPRAIDLNMRLWIDGLHRTPDQVDPRFRERARAMTARTFAHPPIGQHERPLDPPAIGRLRAIHAPTLVLVSALDLKSILDSADLLVSEIPGARKAVIEHAAHLPSMERPDEFNRIVLEFLDNI